MRRHLRRKRAEACATLTAVSPHHLGHTAAGMSFSRLERKLCAWINTQYGCNVDPDDKSTLIAALADGVVLCKLIRDVSGNKQLKFHAKRPNVFAQNENIHAFSAECKKLGKGMMALSPSDLRDGDADKVMGALSCASIARPGHEVTMPARRPPSCSARRTDRGQKSLASICGESADDDSPVVPPEPAEGPSCRCRDCKRLMRIYSSSRPRTSD